MKANQRVGKKRVVRVDSGREFPGLKGKVVKRVEIGKGEDHDLYIHVRFRDETELCFWLTSRIVIEEADLAPYAVLTVRRADHGYVSRVKYGVERCRMGT